MVNYKEKSSTTTFFKANESILSWQGICPTNKSNEYLITGTQTNGDGAIYKGKINVSSTAKIDSIIFPNSASTSVYGP